MSTCSIGSAIAACFIKRVKFLILYNIIREGKKDDLTLGLHFSLRGNLLKLLSE
jgi:hypothetical protein